MHHVQQAVCATTRKVAHRGQGAYVNAAARVVGAGDQFKRARDWKSCPRAALLEAAPSSTAGGADNSKSNVTGPKWLCGTRGGGNMGARRRRRPGNWLHFCEQQRPGQQAAQATWAVRQAQQATGSSVCTQTGCTSGNSTSGNSSKRGSMRLPSFTAQQAAARFHYRRRRQTDSRVRVTRRNARALVQRLEGAGGAALVLAQALHLLQLGARGDDEATL